uniref:Isthmin-1-like n=1 Tax=Petromyzon marinus TaxID=7757 RepID=A0AAJ7U840_PETMA|nr:isthmin-1-like [Petromyzon marinus]XP_032830014.1 isthmin-1-like [Petromyzon marinus]
METSGWEAREGGGVGPVPLAAQSPVMGLHRLGPLCAGALLWALLAASAPLGPRRENSASSSSSSPRVRVGAAAWRGDTGPGAQPTGLLENSLRRHGAKGTRPGKHHYQQHHQQQKHAQPQGDEPAGFPLLFSLPDFSQADFNQPNPNIQVTIEVVSSPEMELDLVTGAGRLDWPEPRGDAAAAQLAPRWLLQLWQRSLEGSKGAKAGGQSDYSYYEEEDGEDDDDNVGYGDGADDGAFFGSRRRGQQMVSIGEEEGTTHEDDDGDDYGDATSPPPITETRLNNTGADSCERWARCERGTALRPYVRRVLAELPSCPCVYPRQVAYGSALIPEPPESGAAAAGGALGAAESLDSLSRSQSPPPSSSSSSSSSPPRRARSVRWRDASGPHERLDVYKPSARYCIRSVPHTQPAPSSSSSSSPRHRRRPAPTHAPPPPLPPSSPLLAAQQCCYDAAMRLVTRGPGAGTPSLVSADLSPELHRRLDVGPWLACRGDWSRYNAARPPNNRRGCAESPRDADFDRLLGQAADF